MEERHITMSIIWKWMVHRTIHSVLFAQFIINVTLVIKQKKFLERYGHPLKAKVEVSQTNNLPDSAELNWEL